jgi:hypothetical protein
MQFMKFFLKFLKLRHHLSINLAITGMKYDAITRVRLRIGEMQIGVRNVEFQWYNFEFLVQLTSTLPLLKTK